LTKDEFAALAETVDAVLAAAGYEPVKAEIDSAFGSHYVQFERSTIDVLRLIWDGKERLLVLESSARGTLATASADERGEVVEAACAFIRQA
jgi:hypothetical protein